MHPVSNNTSNKWWWHSLCSPYKNPPQSTVSPHLINTSAYTTNKNITNLTLLQYLYMNLQCKILPAQFYDVKTSFEKVTTGLWMILMPAKVSNYLIIAAKGGNLGAEPLFEFMWLDYKCHNITDALFELDEWHGALLYVLDHYKCQQHSQVGISITVNKHLIKCL